MDREFLERWKAFEEECKACSRCPLRASASKTVIYRGCKKAPLMIIGEGPGNVEDKTGIPFVGPSGYLLQNALTAWGFRDRDFHICNIVKCHPPENRRPEPSEISQCKRLLATQFRLVEPRVILLCGSTAYEAFYGERPVMRDVRGRFDEKKGYYIMTTYHPAALLRNDRLKIPMFEDLGKVRSKLSELGLMEPLSPLYHS